MTRVYHDEDVPPDALAGETVAVLGYGIQGRAQALCLHESGLEVVVGNRRDSYADQAEADGFAVLEIGEATRRSSVALMLVPDEVQPAIYEKAVEPNLFSGDALVFAHGFAIRYGLIQRRRDVDLLMLAPRMPGHYLRSRYLEGWGVPAYVGVEQDASGRAVHRVLGLARALRITRCAAIEATFAQETELDHFSEHVTFPLILRALELAFTELVAAGYPPEIALMELHGSGELGEVLSAAAREGLYEMLASHASPACQAGIAHYWNEALGSEEQVRVQMAQALQAIRSGRFARFLLESQAEGHPELRRWQTSRPVGLRKAERSLRTWLRGPGPQEGSSEQRR